MPRKVGISAFTNGIGPPKTHLQSTAPARFARPFRASAECNGYAGSVRNRALVFPMQLVVGRCPTASTLRFRDAAPEDAEMAHRSRSRFPPALLALGVAASASWAVEPLATHMTPPPQPPIEAIQGRDVTPVQTLFNRDADRPRVLVLLSPT